MVLISITKWLQSNQKSTGTQYWSVLPKTDKLIRSILFEFI
jgi:hypothetical protein